MKIYWKGELIEEGLARVPVFGGGYLEGCALVETMHVKSGRILNFGLHADRFLDGAKALMMRPLDRRDFEGIARELVRVNRIRQGNLRCRYFRDGALLVHPLPIPAPLAPGRRGIRLITAPVRHYGPESLQGRLKANSMLPNLLSRWETQALAEDGLRLTEQGFVAEGVWTNIMIEKRGVLMTPPLPTGVLDGTTRHEAILRWKKKGAQVLEIPLTRYDLYTADKAWVCSSLRGLLKVSEIDGRKVGKASP